MGAPSPSNLGEMGIVGARGRAPLQRFVSVGAHSVRPRNTAITAHYCRGRRPRRPTCGSFVFPKEEHLMGQGERGERKPQQNPTSPLSPFPNRFSSLDSLFPQPFSSHSPVGFCFYGQAECLSVRPNIIEAVVFCPANT